MTKQDLVTTLSERLNIPKMRCSSFIDAMLDTVMDKLKGGESVKISGFGTFHVQLRDERTGYHPRSGEEIVIPKKGYVRFKPSRNLVIEADDLELDLELETEIELGEI